MIVNSTSLLPATTTIGEKVWTTIYLCENMLRSSASEVAKRKRKKAGQHETRETMLLPWMQSSNDQSALPGTY